MGDPDDSLYKEIGQRVKKARRRKGLSQDDLADHIGLSRSSISNIENGNHSVLVHVLYDMAKALEISTVDLLPPSFTRADFMNPKRQRIYKPEAKWLKELLKRD